jgi:hypothetical protein
MKSKSEQIIFFFIASIMSGVAIFLMGISAFFIGRCIIWLFISGEFIFPLEYVNKPFKAAVITGPVIGLGTWFMYYNPLKLRR